MADEIPDWASAPDWAADEPAKGHPATLSGLAKAAITPITSYPETYAGMNREAREQVSHGVEQLSSPESSLWERTKGAANVALGGLGYAMSPINAAYRTVVGNPVEAVTGIPKEYSEFTAGVLTPGIGLTRLPRAVPTPPPIPTGPLGVVLSEGQRTQSLPAIQREQGAVRGSSGEPAQARAHEFFNQQRGQLEQAGENVSRSLDPFGAQVAETPQQAGEIVSESMRRAAAEARATRDAAYAVAREQPGEIHSSVFRNIGDDIKADLSQRTDPIIIDDLTPRADRALRYIEGRVANLRIPNRADPRGMPNADEIVGLNLEGVDQIRKHISALRRDAFSSGNAADGRAARAVLDAFDQRIDRAVNGGMFNGDPRAIQAWNDARAAHADYRSTFTAQKNDPTGRVVEKIIGRANNPAAIPNDVADFLYGASGVNPSSLNRNVALRVRSILGEQSPEWSAVKQGLFSRLTEPPPGMTDWGSGKIAQRLNRFLNGDGAELAQAVFTEPERRMLQGYADLHRLIEVPQTGANWSNTATFTAKALKRVGDMYGMAAGAALARMVFPVGMPVATELAGAGIARAVSKAGEAVQAGQVARQLPLVNQALERWQRAANLNARIPSTATERTLRVATFNLGRALGIDPMKLFPQSRLPAAAGQDQGSAPGPVDQQKNGGRVNRQADQFAHGGRVLPSNINHSPTEAQKEAGNYAKDHVRVHGLDIAIENAKGKERSGVDKDGKKWSVRMPAHYGYIKRSEGADSDHVDVYLGPHPKAPLVFVVDQVDADSGKFDEHKVLIGFPSRTSALNCYHAAFSDGRGAERFGGVKAMSVEDFKHWLNNGDTKKPIGKAA
jgi:hypothetical protein